MGSEFLGVFMHRSAIDGTEADMSSLESPTQKSITEREGGSFKTMFNKASLDYGTTSDPDEVFKLIDTVCLCENRLCHRGGYPANQKVFGFSAAVSGDVLMSRDEEDNLTHHSMIEMRGVTLQKQAIMRECAGPAFFSTECASAIRRAVASGPLSTLKLAILSIFGRLDILKKLLFITQLQRVPIIRFGLVHAV